MKKWQLTDISDIQDLLKAQFKDIIEEMLEDELGYSKYDYKNKETYNSRNGKRSKNLCSKYGDIEIDVPRDCLSEFELKVVKKIKEWYLGWRKWNI